MLLWLVKAFLYCCCFRQSGTVNIILNYFTWLVELLAATLRPKKIKVGAFPLLYYVNSHCLFPILVLPDLSHHIALNIGAFSCALISICPMLHLSACPIVHLYL